MGRSHPTAHSSSMPSTHWRVRRPAATLALRCYRHAVAYRATDAPSGPDDPPPTVVVVTNSSWGWYRGRAPAESSSVDAMARASLSWRSGDVNPAQRSRHSPAAPSSGVTDPLQFRVALGNLASVVGRILDSNHLRFVLTPEGAWRRRGLCFDPGGRPSGPTCLCVSACTPVSRFRW